MERGRGGGCSFHIPGSSVSFLSTLSRHSNQLREKLSLQTGKMNWATLLSTIRLANAYSNRRARNARWCSISWCLRTRLFWGMIFERFFTHEDFFLNVGERVDCIFRPCPVKRLAIQARNIMNGFRDIIHFWNIYSLLCFRMGFFQASSERNLIEFAPLCRPLSLAQKILPLIYRNPFL